MASQTRLQLEWWLKTIDVPAGRVLDIGGSQNPVIKRTRTWEATEYDIFDLPTPHEEKQKPDIMGDIQYEIEMYEEYDTVFCLEVSEYWHDPMAALKNINQLMTKGGILFISFHFVYPRHDPAHDDCLRYTPAGVAKLLKHTGFRLLNRKPRTTSPEGAMKLMAFYKFEGMRGNYRMPVEEIGCLIKAQKI